MRTAPGPSSRELLSSWRSLRARPLEGLVGLARKHGDIVRIAMVRDYFIVADPAAIRHVLRDNRKSYDKASSFDDLRLLVGDGLLTAGNDTWAAQRRVVAKAFLTRAVHGDLALVHDAAAELAATWHEALAGGAEVSRLVSADFARLTLRLSSTALLGADASAHAAEVGAALERAQAALIDRMKSLAKVPISLPTPSNRELRRSVAALDTILARLLGGKCERESTFAFSGADGGGGADQSAGQAESEFGFGSGRLPAKCERESTFAFSGAGGGGGERSAGEGESEFGFGFRREGGGGEAGFLRRLATVGEPGRVRDEAMTFLLAGYDTTSNALAFTAHLLAAHPEEQERVRREVAAAGRLDAGTLGRLPLLERAIAESLRLYPPVPIILRDVLADDVLGGFRVPRGSVVACVPYLAHRHPGHWDDPEAFRPDRFAAGGDLPAYLPYGVLPRGCIGEQMAQLWMKATLATLLARFRFRAEPGFTVEPDALITLFPRHGLRLRVARATEAATDDVRRAG